MTESDAQMQEGQRVEVKLAGIEEWFPGTVLNRPRKQWVELDAPGPFKRPGFIADEGNIEEWRLLARD